GTAPVIASVDCVPIKTRSKPNVRSACDIAYAVAPASEPSSAGSESMTASSAPIASALRTTSFPVSGAIEKTVTVEPSAKPSRICNAASSAYSSKGLRTVSTPVRTRRLVPGSIRLSAFVSGTSFTVTTIFTEEPLRAASRLLRVLDLGLLLEDDLKAPERRRHRIGQRRNPLGVVVARLQQELHALGLVELEAQERDALIHVHRAAGPRSLDQEVRETAREQELFGEVPRERHGHLRIVHSDGIERPERS